MSKGSTRELPTDRLATTDQDGHRIYLYPADVNGWFRKLRDGVSSVLLLIFLVLPWVRIGGKPAVLLDLPGRKFSIFGLMFWAHDAPIMFFVLGGAVFILAFVTAVWGRLWCGWACPQTVFVDMVYRRVERWIEGDSVARKRLDEAPMSAGKALKKGLKWTAFVLISLIIGHSFLAYFTGTEELAQMVRQSPATNPGAFGVMAFISGMVLFDFGWFREQFCTIACPYGRFQSVLMDDRSMVVSYDTTRGEPRKGKTPPGIPLGDCVNCYKCVAVCPTGIDIRRGVQLECIACTACIDACNDVMTRLGKPRDLIRYGTMQGGSGTVSFLRPRALVYLAIIAVMGAGLAFTIRGRHDLSADFIRAAETPYIEIQGPGGAPWVQNHYKVDLRNQDFVPLNMKIELPEELTRKGAEVVPVAPIPVIQAGQVQRVEVLFRFPKDQLVMGRLPVTLTVSSARAGGLPGDSVTREVKLVGPLK